MIDHQQLMRSLFSIFLIAGSIALMMWPTVTRAQQTGTVGGAGMGLKQADDGRVLIERVAPGGPAAKAGIQAGDWLVGVDRYAVAELNGSQLVDAIRGPVGSKVVLVRLESPFCWDCAASGPARSETSSARPS